MATRKNRGRVIKIAGGIVVVLVGIRLLSLAKTADAGQNLMATVLGLKKFGLDGATKVRCVVVLEIRNPSTKTIPLEYVYLDLNLGGVMAQTTLSERVLIPAGQVAKIEVPTQIPILASILGAGLKLWNAIKAGNIKSMFQSADVKGYIRADGVRVPIQQTVPIL